tara:strand:+ start:1416 stop:2747 length:1332 start_codon:yes stop_codon:yes gene_type:complete
VSPADELGSLPAPELERRKLLAEVRELELPLRMRFMRPGPAIALLVAIGSAASGVAYFQTELREARITRLKAQEKALESKIVELRAAWAQVSAQSLREPSGLTHSGIEVEKHPIALAIHDELQQIYLLRAPVMPPTDLDTTLRKARETPALAVERILPLRVADGVNDLEAVCYDGKASYYALASHRRYDKPKVMSLLSFKVDPGLAKEPNGEVAASSAVSSGDFATGMIRQFAQAGVAVSSPEFDLASVLEARAEHKEGGQKRSRTSFDVAGRNWGASKGSSYAVELEGLAYRPGKSGEAGELLIGARRPQTRDKKAIILICQLHDSPGRIHPPTAHLTLDLGGYGISALALDQEDGYLYVGANPPKKSPESYGKSRIYVFKRSSPGFDRTPVSVSDFPRAHLKLEGVAVLRTRSLQKQLWLTYEGDGSPAFAKIDLPLPLGR